MENIDFQNLINYNNNIKINYNNNINNMTYK